MKASRNRRTSKTPDRADTAEMLDLAGSSSSHKLLDNDIDDFKINIVMSGGDASAAPRATSAWEADGDPSTCKLNPGTDDEMLARGYRAVMWRVVALWAVIASTAGLLWLIFYWVPRWKLQLTHKVVPLAEADTILVEEKYKNYSRYYVKSVYTLGSRTSEDKLYEAPDATGPTFRKTSFLRFFRCQKMVYLWSDVEKSFFALHGLDVDVPISAYHECKGMTKEEQETRRLLYGPNAIIVPEHSIPYYLVKEVLNPFYVFQLFSVCLWFSDQYYYYAAAIVVMSAYGISAAVYQTRKNEGSLRSTIHSSDTVSVWRGGDVFEMVQSDELVPGDVISIPQHGCVLHCDAVLIAGTAIVNEAMLTGESVPVTKTMVPKHRDEIFEDKENARNTLYCGTQVIQTRNYSKQKVLAVVLRTGFMTAKGSLVRSIMYPAPVDFKFEQDSYKFVLCLTGIAAIGFVYTCVTKAQRRADDESLASIILLDALDLITIVVPPALPAAMTIGYIYAQKRLKKKNIFCISPRTINVSGSIDCVCFDKTGTLTEDGLDMWGVIAVQDEKKPVTFDVPEKNPSNLKVDSLLVHGMATCHSLTIINDELSGDPLDLKMFEATGWALEEPASDSSEQFDNLAPTVVRPASSDVKFQSEHELGVIRQFPFSSARQCMSVIVRGVHADHFTVFCKGSPEKIMKMADQATLPENFHSLLASYTEKGYRVIAMGKRDMDKSVKLTKIQRMERDEAEADLEFLGLIVMENRIKKETAPIIRQLQRANLRTIMITGDNINTAISVAKECGMITHGRIVVVTAWMEDVEPDGSGGTPRVQFHVVDTVRSPATAGAGHTNGTAAFPKLNMMEKLGYSSVDIESMYHFAIDGHSFGIVRDHFPNEFDRIAVRGAVFARMSPDQKQSLIEHLQSLNYYVAMCGDGANDCGALKAAHAGVSLSDTEASVASPFTSKEPNISCIPELIKQGRCALVTSFGIFKYMMAYSLTQFTSVIILYNIESNLTDIGFLYIDLFLITIFAFLFGMTGAYEGELAPTPPMKSLISFTPIVSLMLQLGVIVGFQVLAFLYVQEQDWFVPFNYTNTNYSGLVAPDGSRPEEYYLNSTIGESSVACWENYAVFSVSAFQYIILAYAYSKSHPYRQKVFTNLPFIGTLLFMTGFTIYLVLGPSHYLQASLELFLPPDLSFRGIILGFAACNVVLCVILEDFVVEFLIFKVLRKRCHSTKRSKRQFLRINKWLSENDSNWPPLSSTPRHANATDTPLDSSPIESIKVDLQIVDDEKEAFESFAPSAKNTPTHGEGGHSAAAVLLNTVPSRSTNGSANGGALHMGNAAQ